MESMGGDFFQGGGLALILSLCERGVEINFCLMRGVYDLVPPLQVIVAQFLTSTQNCPNTPPPPFLIYHAYFI